MDRWGLNDAVSDSSPDPDPPDGEPSAHDGPIVVFDGICNLCNRSVDFIVRHDTDSTFRFAANQSAAAARLLGSGADDLETIALVEPDRVTYRSTAALRIARQLSWPWKGTYAAIIVPRPVRDAAYRLLSKNRYRWFGTRDTCRLPTADEEARFLD